MQPLHICSSACSFSRVKDSSEWTFVCDASGHIHECGEACSAIIHKDGKKVCTLLLIPVATFGTTSVCVSVGSEVQGIGDGSSKLRRAAKTASRCGTGAAGAVKRRKALERRKGCDSEGEVVALAASSAAERALVDIKLTHDYNVVLDLVRKLMDKTTRARGAHAIAKNAQEQADTALSDYIFSTISNHRALSFPECVGVFYRTFSDAAHGIDSKGCAHLPSTLADRVVRCVLYNWALYKEMTTSAGAAGIKVAGSSQVCKTPGSGSALTLHDFALGLLLVLRDREVKARVRPCNAEMMWVPTDGNAKEFKKSNTNKLLPLQQTVGMFLENVPTSMKRIQSEREYIEEVGGLEEDVVQHGVEKNVRLSKKRYRN
jgi:hypothetical protein